MSGNTIVTVNVNQIVAPTPNLRQKRGTFVSMGGTTTAVNTKTLLTTKTDLSNILAASLAITSIAWASSVATVTTAAALGARYPNGTTFQVVIAGATPAGYSGTFTATVTGASTFTYPLVSNPGAETVPGTWENASAIELAQMNNTFWSQGSTQAVYVLELGPGTVSNAVSVLDDWIPDNDNFFYSYLVPREWDTNSDYLALLAEYENTTSQTYFFTTTTTNTYTSYSITMKDVYAGVEAPSIPATEFSLAADFFVTLNYAPSTVNKVTPLAFSFVFGVTPFPTVGNQTLFTQLKAAGVNWKGTGAEGGISDTIILWGTTMDVRPFNYWYSVDWTQINVDLAIANAVINGSNNPANPLYFDQAGINRLQQVGASTLSSGVTFGMILGRVTQTALDGPDYQEAVDDDDFAGQANINAIPFVPYNKANPSDYKLGNYSGFAVTMTPLRGFESITFNIGVTDFVA